MPIRFPTGLHRKELRAWASYDWANSAFATTILAAVFPIFYSKVAGDGLPGNQATVRFAYTSSMALVLVALIAPILGAIADEYRAKKKMLAVFALIGITFTAAFYGIQRGDWLTASILFILANFGFAGANVFYDSLLPHVAHAKEIDRVSTAGYAVGYIGGGILLLVHVFMMQQPAWFGFGNAETATRAVFLTVSLWWLVFSLPIFLRVPEPGAGILCGPSGQHLPPRGQVLGSGFRRLRSTFGELKSHREAFKFLLAFWLYSDGIGTVIKMAAIYGTEIGIGQSDLIGALLLVQFAGIPFTFLFGNVAGRIGAKRGIMLALSVYSIVSILGFFMSQAWHFWALALLVAVVQGGSQALSRSFFSGLIPKEKSAEFFGFYGISEKFAGILGPLIFALVGQAMGSSRLGILSLLVFFLGGMLLLSRVDNRRVSVPHQ